jgi:hypothetical protein
MFASGWLNEIRPELERCGTVSDDQIALLRGCVDLIDRQIPSGGPLWEACPHGDQCWRTDRGPRPPRMSARIPYIGPTYAEHRIAVVAINSRDNGHAGAEIKTTRNVLESLRAGHREYGFRSFFHYRVASTVHNALMSLNGNPLDERPEPGAVAESLLASARLQAVQCSPVSTSRQTPTRKMVKTCPEFLLRRSLEILVPRVLLLFGAAAHQAIEHPPLSVEWETTWPASRGCFSRGQTSFQDQTMTILAFHHPSAARWTQSWSACLASLEARDLAQV